MTDPSTDPIPPAPRPPDARPLRKRVLVWVGGVVLFVAGLAIGATGDDEKQSVADEAEPTTTVTATAAPKPGPTVTRTATPEKKPGPTVTVTVTRTATAEAADTGSGNSGADGTADSAGTCTIVSSSGNCYSAGQFCRNADHGATTSTASGQAITCAYHSNGWRWTYA